MRHWILWGLLYFSVSCGCAQTHYHASELPQQYYAPRNNNYALLDLTPYSVADADPEEIQSGDRLAVALNTGMQTENADVKWEVSVDDSGEAALPNIGKVKLAGLSKTEAQDAIVQTSLQRQVFLTPTVTVDVAERDTSMCTVTGAVTTPGELPILNGTISLADVLVRAGGLTNESNGIVSVTGQSDNFIRAISSSEEVKPPAMTIDLANTAPAELAKIRITDGTVINAESRPPSAVQVIGVIRNSAVEVPFGENLTMIDALTMAGGQTYSNWISDRVTITRQVPGRNETVRIGASIRDASANANENLVLAPNDIIRVEENILTFTLSTLSGFIGAGFNAARIAP